MKRRWIARFLLTTGIVLSALTDVVSMPARQGIAGHPDRSRADHTDKSLKLIAVPEEEEWLVLVAAPIAAQIRSKQETPILVVLSSDQTEEQRLLLDQLNLVSKSCFLLSQDQDRSLFGGPDEAPAKLKVVRPSLAQVSVQLAKSFWNKADNIVAASTNEPEAAILGSTLAAHLRVPFFPYENARDLRVLSKALDAMDVNTVLFSTNKPHGNQLGVSSFKQKVEYLDSSSVNKRIIQLLGAGNIRNIILTRMPEPETQVGGSSWIAPYLSLMRGAPVIACSSLNATAAEEQVAAFIRSHSLKPQTVTVLADYESIGTVDVTDQAKLGEYEIYVEPCSRPLQGAAASMGVGRIPFRELWSCSTMIARGFFRESVSGGSELRVQMVANPESQYGSLPLAETVSRATAEEFKNFGIKINEFYGVPSNNSESVEAAKKAHLIIYEGHVSDQSLLQDPCSIFEAEEQYQEEWGYVPIDDLPSSNSAESEPASCTDDEVCYTFSTEGTTACDDYPAPISYHEETFYSAEPTLPLPNIRIDRLEGLPLIVLQSCHSLEEDVAKYVFSLGGVGLVGSVTNVHSASGSAFIKAFCDGLLYNGDTIGEALRDARNYFLCLRDLKQKRGHTEMAKVYRAALSFCLWGDPEIRITTGSTRNPKLQPLSAKFIAPDKISISTPKHRLPESRTEKYFVRMFPASQVAGIVKRTKTGEARRLTPFYFFRLPVPRGFDAQQYTNLQRKGESPNRAVFITDAFERFLYVLYFPAKEVKDDKFELQFTK